MSGDLLFAGRRYRKVGGTWMMHPTTLPGFIAVAEESTSVILDEIERLRAAGDRLAAAINAVACSGPRDEMAELTAAYIDWEARRG